MLTTVQALPRPRPSIRVRLVLKKMSFQTRFTFFLLYGFFFLDRLLVYIALPLSILLVFDRRIFLDRVYNALTKRGYLSGVTWALLALTIYGLGEVVHGLMTGSRPDTVLEVFVFNICPWFIFLGIVAGMERPLAVKDYILFMAYYHAIGTPLYYLFLRHLPLPSGADGLFAPGTGSMILLGIFCYEKNLGRLWFPILVCSFDTIAAEMRADWVGLGIAVVVWGIATGKLQRVVSMTAILVMLLGIGFVADFKIPGLPGRGGEISARDTVGRALSSIDPKLAQEYSTNAGVYAGTVQWRENWWKAIREQVFKSPATTAFGLGYGYPIKDLVAYLRGADIRSPHSVFYFTLAYSGLVGVFLFAILQAHLLNFFWHVYRRTKQIFGFAFAIMMLVNAMFGNLFESPQRSLPIYIVYGMCMGPLLLAIQERAVTQKRLMARMQISEPAWGQDEPVPASRLLSGRISP
jgi:hypothetical protein